MVINRRESIKEKEKALKILHPWYGSQPTTLPDVDSV
jgi:hypothetical protein